MPQYWRSRIAQTRRVRLLPNSPEERMAPGRSIHLRLAAFMLVALAAPASVSAQHRVKLSPGLAIGTAFDRPQSAGSSWVTGRHTLLTLDVETMHSPLRLRGEVMAVALNQSHGPVSVGASAVLPLGRGTLRPYVVAGSAFYGVGGVGHPVGWSAGGGAEYRRRTTTLFLEARRHTETASAVSLGLRF